MPAPDDAARHVGHRPDHIQRRRRAQRHLQRRQAARHQRLGKRRGMGHVLDHQNRDDRGQPADLGGSAALLGGGHVQVLPSRRDGRFGWHPAGGSADVSRQTSHDQRRAIGGQARRCWRKAANNSRPMPKLVGRQIGHDRFAVVEIRGQHVSVPATASSRTTSPSRSRASGPPIAASGQTWIAAGTLPDAPDIRPSVTSATFSPRSCSTDSVGVRLMQFRHPVRLRPLKAHDDDGVRGELARLEGALDRRPGRGRPAPAPRSRGAPARLPKP